MSDETKSDATERASEFLSIFRKGAEFTRELIEENQRLRHQVAEIQDRQNAAAQNPAEWDKLRGELLEKIQSLEADREEAFEQLRAIEEENQQFISRYLEVEEENNNLANLYISSFQLHSTLDISETLKTILEIVINLVGAERFAVMLVDEKTDRVEPVAAEGGNLEEFSGSPVGEGPVGGCLASGEVEYPVPPEQAGQGTPIVSIPLSVQDHKIGVLAIYSLLQQKSGFTPLDHELFSLLAGHAATALFASQLHSQSERKLSTMQGFIELLSK